MLYYDISGAAADALRPLREEAEGPPGTKS